MKDIFEQMISQYSITSENDRRNAVYEVMQQVTLAGLQQGGFFDHAAFYGGTCLRIFHHINRFSEDMDFSLLAPMDDFQLTSYFPAIIDLFESLGRHIDITKKEKSKASSVESAFLKDTTETYHISFQTEKNIKIKLEVDTNPPLQFSTEQKLLLQPYSFMTRCFTLPDLFAGKMHALLFRTWKNRVKGRDWYDFEWYVKNNVPLNFTHLQERVRQFNGQIITQQEFISLLQHRLSTTDIDMVKRDVMPFLKNPKEIEIWSNDYFVQLMQFLKIE